VTYADVLPQRLRGATEERWKTSVKRPVSASVSEAIACGIRGTGSLHWARCSVEDTSLSLPGIDLLSIHFYDFCILPEFTVLRKE
jgi:hypothetical protein